MATFDRRGDLAKAEQLFPRSTFIQNISINSIILPSTSKVLTKFNSTPEFSWMLCSLFSYRSLFFPEINKFLSSSLR
jgi:hypothetical protein